MVDSPYLLVVYSAISSFRNVYFNLLIYFAVAEIIKTERKTFIAVLVVISTCIMALLVPINFYHQSNMLRNILLFILFTTAMILSLFAITWISNTYNRSSSSASSSDGSQSMSAGEFRCCILLCAILSQFWGTIVVDIATNDGNIFDTSEANMITLALMRGCFSVFVTGE